MSSYKKKGNYKKPTCIIWTKTIQLKLDLIWSSSKFYCLWRLLILDIEKIQLRKALNNYPW